MESKKLEFDKKKFADRLGGYRLTAGFSTVEEFAEAYDLEYNSPDQEKSIYKSLGNYERGNTIPSVERIFQLCNVLRRDPGELLGLYDTAPPFLSEKAFQILRDNPDLVTHINYLIEHYSPETKKQEKDNQ